MNLLRTDYKPLVPFIFSLMLTSCATNQQSVNQTFESQASRIADLQIVDCLLPGQVRRLGNTSYLSPRRPINTAAADCRIRGGEYVEYDRADYKSSLNVWMTAAENGDLEAQTNVGEIFERGHGGTPNYEAAAIWYTKAANQGNSRAQFNLGTLYEQGLGVEQNKLLALNWYRKAWGLPEDDLIYQSAAHKEQQSLRIQLQKLLNEKSSQIKLLKKQMQQLNNKIRAHQQSAEQQQTQQQELQQLQASTSAQQDTEQLQQELQQLRDWVDKLEQEKNDTQNQYTALPIFREPKAIQSPSVETTTPSRSAKDIKFGKYYALIIGNQNYARLDSLYSPRRDARQVAQLLESKYGFSVQMLLDASNIDIMKAINNLNTVLNEEDNLLIFYAGHGSRVKNGNIIDGYWLPINADPPPTDTFWVSNEFVTRHLSRLKAKRVLVVADSCYAGLLSNAPGYLFMGDDKKYTDNYIRYKLAKKARLILSSGGDKPVLDNAGQGNSVFASAFLKELEANEGVLTSPELYIKIRDRVTQGSRAFGYEQEPEFKAIKGAGHEVGDFFFVPSGSS